MPSVSFFHLKKEYWEAYWKAFAVVELLATLRLEDIFPQLVAFGFLPQNLWMSQGLTNGTLSFCECMLSVKYTQRQCGYPQFTYCNQIHLHFLCRSLLTPLFTSICLHIR